MIPRKYVLEKMLVPNKVIVLFGPRQVGKTTLLKELINSTKLNYLSVNGDDTRIHRELSDGDMKKILDFAAGKELIVIDEAQKIPNVGLALKILVDNIPGIRIVVTGSSSFELAGQVGEPLTGRKFTYKLFPIAISELKSIKNNFEISRELEDYLIFGSYPGSLNVKTKNEKVQFLNELTDSYLLKDILELEKVKNSQVLQDILRLLAFQVGSEVSLHEIGRQVQLDYKTVARYLDLMEKAFVIYSVRGYSKNLRKEISKMAKYYFYDNGIRNALISNFNPLALRFDQGQLWENFIFSERIKHRAYEQIYANSYFWRTYDQKEIDLIEERDGRLFGFEFKWKEGKVKVPKEFLETYAEGSFEVINRENYLGFIC